MVQSGTSGGTLSMNPSVTAPWTEGTSVSAGEEFHLQITETEILTQKFLIVIFALLGLPVNAVVLWLLGFRIQRNAFSVYILNLAAADFLFLACNIMNALITLINHYFSKSIYIPLGIIIVPIFCYIAGMSILSTISTERCLSVLWPVWYRCHRPRHMSAVMCALLWGLSLLVSILQANYCGFLSEYSHEVCCKVFDFITVAWLILLFVLLSGSSLALVTRLLCGFQRIQLTRLYVTIMVTVLTFLICGLPFGIHWFLLLWVENDINAFLSRLLIAVPLSCVNSCANPIIYFFVGSFRQQWWKQRQGLRLVLQRALQDFPDEDSHRESLPQESMTTSTVIA